MNRSTGMFSRWAAVFAGVSLFAASASYFFWPAQMIRMSPDFFQVILDNAGLYRFTYLAFALAALAALAVVQAVQDRLYPEDRGLLRWVSLVGAIGFVMTFANFVYMQNQAVYLANVYKAQQQRYSGYGLMIDLDEDGVPVLAPLALDSPAGRAEIHPGDRLKAIDGKAIAPGTPASAIIDRMGRTAEGIILTVERAGQPAHDVLLQRAEVRMWNTSVQLVLQEIGLPSLDPDYFIGFGLPGLWLMVINGWGLRKKVLPAALAMIGVLAGAGFWLFVAGFWWDLAALNLAGQGLGLTLGPVWFVWMGIRQFS
jgi:membrane-associated protease RseP (regulator of RpoE activity)